MKFFPKPTVPKHYDKASANKVLELIGSSKKMPPATISAAESYIKAEVNFDMFSLVHGNVFLELKFT